MALGTTVAAQPLLVVIAALCPAVTCKTVASFSHLGAGPLATHNLTTRLSIALLDSWLLSRVLSPLQALVMVMLILLPALTQHQLPVTTCMATLAVLLTMMIATVATATSAGLLARTGMIPRLTAAASDFLKIVQFNQ